MQISRSLTAARLARGALPYVQALAIYLCSRLVVGFGIAFGKVYITLGNETWLGGASWYHWLLRWDSEWYKIIATEGYRYNGDPGQTQTVVFYPLYPWLSWAASEILRIEIFDAMLLVANLAGLSAVLLLFKLVRERFDDRIALVTVAMISFFPSSVFLSAGYTEPLALLFMVAFFLAIARQRFVAAAVLAGLAVGTRSSGIALLPVLVWELWLARDTRAFFRAVVPLCIVATSGLWLYMLYLGVTFGRPLAFADAQAAFHANTTMASRLVSALTLEPFRNIDWTDFSPAGLDHWFILVFIGLICIAYPVGASAGMTIFAAAIVALPYFTLSGGPAGFTSMARFNIVSFPLFLVAALLTHRFQWAVLGLVGILAALLLMYAALFARWQWVG